MGIDFEEVLKVPLEDNDSGASNIREYLFCLLMELWQQQESFLGKRPFGNSGWDYDLITALAQAGFIDGEFDEYGDVIDIDASEGHEIISKTIGYIFSNG